MARLTEVKLEGYLLLISAIVTSLGVGPLIGFIWSYIDEIERDIAVTESHWLYKLGLPISVISFILVYLIINHSRRKFLFVALAGFPTALFLFLMTAQLFTRWMKPLDHPLFGRLLVISFLVGSAVSMISMMVGKLVTMAIIRLSASKLRFP